jgi:hypothetical protein
VTSDETWISFANVETKKHLEPWMHTHPPNKPKKFKQIVFARKLIVTVFWYRKGVPMVKFVQQGTIVISEVYCKTLKTCVGPFKTKGIECWRPV